MSLYIINGPNFLTKRQRLSESTEKLSPAVCYFMYERHTQNVRHKRTEKRYTNEKKLLCNSIIQTDFKAKIISRNERDHCNTDRRNNAPGK